MMLPYTRTLPIPGRRRGFTIVEIVIACIIIGILTLALVPTLTRQTNEARINVAKQDLEHLANAMERACIDTGYLYRPYVLNDVSNGDGIANAPAQWPYNQGDKIDRINGMRDNAVTQNNLYQTPQNIFISATTQDFVQPSIQTTLFTRLTGSANGALENPDMARSPLPEELFHWNGPYLNWKRDDNHNDWPDDPWGHDYLFFTRMGMISPPLERKAGGGADPGDGTSGGTPTTDTSYPFQQMGPLYFLDNQQVNFETIGDYGFDRPTWVSLGPNGVPGSGTTNKNDVNNYGYGKGDDLVFSFGGS